MEWRVFKQVERTPTPADHKLLHTRSLSMNTCQDPQELCRAESLGLVHYACQVEHFRDQKGIDEGDTEEWKIKIIQDEPR